VGDIALLTAALDLQLVRLIRGAMAGPAGADCSKEPKYEQRQVIHPEPKYEERRVITPDPVYKRPQVITPDPKYVPAPLIGEAPQSDAGHCHTYKVEAPWKVLPWEKAPPSEPVQNAPRVKVVKVQPDMARRGAVLNILW
jgi:hypothetical protein